MIVGNHDHGGPLFVSDAAEQFHELSLSMAVVERRRFIGERDTRLVRQGTGNGDPLLLTIGNRIAVGAVGP